MREIIFQVLSQIPQTIDLVSILIGAFLLIIFVLFFTIGLMMKRRILRLCAFFLAGIVLASAPPVIVYGSKHYFYKLEMIQDRSRPLAYSPSFLIDMSFKNSGKIDFKKCFIIITPKRKVQNLLNRIRDVIYPLARIEYVLKQKIPVGQTYEFSKIIPYSYKNYSYQFSVDCR